MEPEDKKLLESTYKLSEENNKMLRHIRRSQKIAVFMRLLYWVVIIGISVGIFYFLQPYADRVQEFFKSAGDTVNQFKNILPK